MSLITLRYLKFSIYYCIYVLILCSLSLLEVKMTMLAVWLPKWNVLELTPLIMGVLIFQREFEEICDHFKTHEHARLILKYDEALSHLIYAASDMLIIPSIFEPCGLTQVSCTRGIIIFRLRTIVS